MSKTGIHVGRSTAIQMAVLLKVQFLFLAIPSASQIQQQNATHSFKDYKQTNINI